LLAFFVCARSHRECDSPAGPGAREAGRMDEPTQDDLFLDAVEAIVLDALARIGDDPRARFAFFKRLPAVADEEAVRRCLSLVAPSTRRARESAPAVVPAGGRARRIADTALSVADEPRHGPRAPCARGRARANDRIDDRRRAVHSRARKGRRCSPSRSFRESTPAAELTG